MKRYKLLEGKTQLTNDLQSKTTKPIGIVTGDGLIIICDVEGKITDEQRSELARVPNGTKISLCIEVGE